MDYYGISSVNERAGFLGTVVHESNHLSSTLESLNYSSQALRANWPTRFDDRTAQQYGRNADHRADDRMIAILAYGGRMGNAPHPSDDGWVYRGRGPIQITGLDNYRAFAEHSGMDVVSDPDLLLDPAVGARSAGWFWSTHQCGPAANRADWRTVRKIVNGGVFGLEEFQRYTSIAIPLLV